MSAERWDRLAADLRAAGVPDVRIETRAWSEARFGRIEHGATRRMTLVGERGDTLVIVRDIFDRRTGRKWLGYEVGLEGRADGIHRRSWRWTAKRSEAVAAVLEARAAELRPLATR